MIRGDLKSWHWFFFFFFYLVLDSFIISREIKFVCLKRETVLQRIVILIIIRAVFA